MEKFSLMWKDFRANVHRSFQNLRREENFFDITLVGDDSNHVTAHKLVLSSCSEYFKNVFLNNKKYFQSNAMICMEGLNQTDLNNILDYIYHGEVQIYQHELDRFLGIAERLKLEGLIGGEEEDVQNDDKTEHKSEEDIETVQNNRVSKSDFQKTKDIRATEKTVISFQPSDVQSMDELHEKVEASFTKVGPKNFSCNHCDKSFKNSGHVREHVEIHFEGLSFPCSLCDSILRSRTTLRKHYYNVHNFGKNF